jgi:hypothetical protein
MPASLVRRSCGVAAALSLAAALPGCAVVGVASSVASATVAVGSAAVGVASTVVGTTVKVAGKVVEKTVDAVAPSAPATPSK